MSLAPPFFSLTVRHLFGELLSPRIIALYSFPMRDFMLCATCARLSVGALGVGGGSVSIRARQGGGIVGDGFVRGEYAQERQ